LGGGILKVRPTIERHPLWVLVGLFIVSRVLARAIGVEFLDNTRNFYQFLEPRVLRADVVGSLWNLHMQPPLFNAFLWFTENGSVFGARDTAAVAFLACGLAITILSYQLAKLLDFGTIGAVVIAALVAVAPATLLYENWLYPTLPVAVCTLGATTALAWFARTQRSVALALCLGACAVLVYLRSVFHPLWFFGVFAVIALWQLRAGFGIRRLVIASLVPVLLVAGLTLKNVTVFGEIGTSTWLGMSLARLSAATLEPPEQRRAMRDGSVDGAAFLPAFSHFAQYHAAGIPRSAPTGIEIRDDPTKSDGAPNFNYDGYLEVNDRLLHSNLVLIREYPSRYAEQVGRAYQYFLSSPTYYGFLDPNRAKIDHYENAWRTLVYGEIPVALDPYGGPFAVLNIGWVVAASLLLLLALGAAALAGRPRHLARRVRTEPAVVFGIALVLYFMVATSATELGENNRFRFEIEPLLIVLTCAAVRLIVARRERRPVQPSPSLKQ
jgi:hypothetical protein